MIYFQSLNTQLKFDDGHFPTIVGNQLETASLDDTLTWLKENQHDLEAELARSGAILFRGFPIKNAEDFDAFSGAFAYPSFTYQESLSNAVRINYTERVFTANEAPKEVEIYLHHEMAQTPLSPSKLFFFCQSAAESGGATPICRSDHLFIAISERLPALAQKFEEQGIRYTTSMPAENDSESGQGRSWKDTLSVANASQAEAKLKELGYDWQWQDNGSLSATSPVLPAVIEHHGDKIFYNQLIAAFMGWQGVRENPSVALQFGDGSALSADDLLNIADWAEEFTFDLPWQDGDVALIDNRRAMHGRRPYSGNRKRLVLVALAA